MACGRRPADGRHQLLHTPGWKAQLEGDGTFAVTNPYGGVRTTAPPRALLVC